MGCVGAEQADIPVGKLLHRITDKTHPPPPDDQRQFHFRVIVPGEGKIRPIELPESERRPEVRGHLFVMDLSGGCRNHSQATVKLALVSVKLAVVGLQGFWHYLTVFNNYSISRRRAKGRGLCLEVSK